MVTSGRSYESGGDQVVGTRPAADLIQLVLKPVAQRDVSLERLRVRRTLRSGQLSRDISTTDVKALCADAGGQHVHSATIEGRPAACRRDSGSEPPADLPRRCAIRTRRLDAVDCSGWPGSSQRLYAGGP